MWTICLIPPGPQAAAFIGDEERRVRESDGREVDGAMKNSIEGIIIKWTHQVMGLPSPLLLLSLQVDEVLSKESDQELLDGGHPGPMAEIRFWDAK